MKTKRPNDVVQSPELTPAPGRSHGRRMMSLMLGCSLFTAIPPSALAAVSAAAPIQIPVTPDSQVQLSLSNTNPNMLVIPGDRIIAVDSAQGVFMNTGDYGQSGQANGGVVLMTEKTTPFTFYLRTEGGLVISVVAHPQKRDGRVVHLLSHRPVSHSAAMRWERSQPYVSLLVEVQKALLNGRVPRGYVAAPVVAAPRFSLPSALSARPDAMWSGGQLRVYRYRVINQGAQTVTLPERLFAAPGVRSVLISPWGPTLMPAATTTVYITVSQSGDDHG
ncbi:type-F conjugative transfer system secretin TraK (plasmid) [Edwardsiella tarda]|uniref:type-F conjugative transfer system secretin TraK n=1 Tax=Edwardsiella tarda TaxID=636 RepID=UPI001FA6DF63|nr:type-F conjugative transfer system secretin TraK [Edwardsiella tarda]UCQ29559.1 type-F conjugative transfer system secretin TraK [Edwardsiella tarda]